MASDGFFPRRTVHLDFHTGPAITGVGSAFEPERFADIFADAHVDSVTVFAKCHHGMLYYDTGRPERHPGLSRDLDLLGAQIDALHARGIRAPIYMSVQCDEWAADLHPEWIAMDGLSQIKWSGDRFSAGWQILDMSSPYQDFLAEQITEVVERYAPLDGLFLDMCWDQPSTSIWAAAGMRSAGLDPTSKSDRAQHARQVAHAYMARFRDQVEPHLNPSVASGVWFNSRPKTALVDEQRFLRHVEIEALPSGGWGYSFFPYTARFVRRLGKPTLSHTGRFHKSWGDNGGLKPVAALRYETTQVLAQGMTAGVGDLLPPDGMPRRAVYGLIGDAYAHLQACEPFVDGGVVRSEAALVVEPALGDLPGAAGIGALRVLQQLRVQFDIVTPDADLGGYELVVIPETTPVTGALANAVRSRAATGRAVLISRGADAETLDDDLTDVGFVLGDPLPYSTMFVRATDACPGITDYDHAVYRRGIRMAAEGGVVLWELVRPYFERDWTRFSGHSYTPSSGRTVGLPAVAQVGSVIVAAVPLLESVATDAAPVFRDIVRSAVNRLLPEPLVRAAGPVHLETSLMVGPERTVLHLISFVASRAAQLSGQQHLMQSGLDLVEDPFPLVDVAVDIRTDRPVFRAHLEPGGSVLPLEVMNGFVRTTVSTAEGHAMIVLDHVER
jgi:Hypothetical glycosyl hydrolase 6